MYIVIYSQRSLFLTFLNQHKNSYLNVSIFNLFCVLKRLIQDCLLMPMCCRRW